jgi:hypothetical protein
MGRRVSVMVEEGPSSMQEIWPYNTIIALFGNF